MFTKTRRPDPAYTDDDPRIVVALRMATEPRARRWNFFLTGCVVESVLLFIAILSEAGFGTVAPQTPKPAKAAAPTLLYVPPLRKPHADQPPPPNTLAGRRVPRLLTDPAPPATKVKIDMSAIEISVVDDAANEIPAVVRQQNGRLALLDADDPSYARYTFKPPDWQMSEQMEDVSRRIRFTMTPPSKWPLLQTLAASNGIKMERYQVNALFDGAFSDCLEQEIRNHTIASPGAGRVSAVVLAFNSSRSCGIDVLNVAFAPVR
jgi:hypothetical protein